MSFPFPQLLAFLEDEKDQVEFMQVAAEAGLGSGDIELAKLLLALQLYKAFYAAIPRQIKAVHEDALAEIRRIRDEAEFISNRASSDAVKIGQWAERIHRSLEEAEPRKLAALVHKRLVEDTLSAVGGSAQALVTAYGRIDTATEKLNAAAYQAEMAVDVWQSFSLRRIWMGAFCGSLALAALIMACIWFFYLRYQPWAFAPIQHIYESQIHDR